MYDYTDTISKLNDQFEYVKDFGTFILGVDKVGGGTRNKGYAGRWEVSWFDCQGNHVEDMPVNTGMPYLHEAVAELVAGEILGEL